MEELINKVKDYHEISKSSARNQVNNQRRVKEEIGAKNLKNLKKIKQFLAPQKTSTQRSYIISLARVMEANDELNQEEQEKLMDQFDELTKKNEKEREGGGGGAAIPKIDFVQKLKDINAEINKAKDPKKVEKLLQEKLVILVHSEIPVRRAMDYQEMIRTDKSTEELKKQKDGVNQWNGKDFVFKKYKTARKHGTEVIKPTPRIKRTLGLLEDIREEIGRDDPHIFLNRSGKPQNNPSWNKQLMSVFDVSTNALRKLQIRQNVNTKEVRKAMELAEKMGHTIETAEKDQFGIEEKNEPEDE